MINVYLGGLCFCDSMGNGACLLDTPRINLLDEIVIKKSDNEIADFRKPGEIFDMDYQCELIFGPTSRICPFMPVCKRLWCTVNGLNGGCKTQHMPWADGTPCGRHAGSQCLKGKCVNLYEFSPKPRNGGWGPWSIFSNCSRPCNGGVLRAIRECDNPK
jgi:thrombospondin-like protein, putative